MPEGKNNYLAGDVIQDTDLNQIADNANDAGGFRDGINAGETINGATLPVAAYINKTDNEVYACDADDTDKLKFVGFAISDSTDGNPISLQLSGVVGGFTGLDEGEKYYVQDDKTIGTSPGTNEVLVGIAISTTELLIMKGRRYACGSTSFSSTTTTAITTGFRPSKVTVYAIGDYNGGTGDRIFSSGGWAVSGGNECVYSADGSTLALRSVNKAWFVREDNSPQTDHQGTITTITDTGFTLDNVKTNSPGVVYLFWTAEGDL